MEMAPKSDIIKQFISQITENWNEVGQPLLEIRSISTSGSTNASRFRLDQIDEAVEHAEAMNKSKANIYMCINPIDPIMPIPAGKAAKDTDILAAFYCFADADTKGAMENIMSFAGPKFTMSVKTGTTPFARGHAYWQLEEPVKNLDAWREVQKSIAASLSDRPGSHQPITHHARGRHSLLAQQKETRQRLRPRAGHNAYAIQYGS